MVAYVTWAGDRWVFERSVVMGYTRFGYGRSLVAWVGAEVRAWFPEATLARAAWRGYR